MDTDTQDSALSQGPELTTGQSIEPAQAVVQEDFADDTEVEFASFGRRFLAWSIDHLILAPVCLLITVGYIELFTVVPSALWELEFGIGLFYGIDILYNVVGTWLFGASIGKEILSLRTVTLSGEPVSLGKTLIREIVGKLLCQATFLFGFIMVARRPDRRGLHDLMAGTCVIWEKP